MRIITFFIHSLLVCILLISSLSIGLAETVTTQRVPVDDLLRSDFDSGFALSPDGKYVVFVQKLPGRKLLVFTDLDEMELMQWIPLGKAYPTNLQWISKRRVVFEVAGAIFAVNIDGSETRSILPNIYNLENKKMSYSKMMRIFRNWTVLHTLPESREEILVSGINNKKIASVYRLNVFTGKLTEVVDGKKQNISRWWSDRRGKVRLGQAQKKGDVIFYVRDPVSGKVDQLAVVDHEAGYPLSYDGRSYINQRVFVSTFSYDDDVIYLAENIDKDRFRLVRYSLSQRKIIDTLIEDDRYDIGSTDTGTKYYFLDAEEKLVGISYNRSKYHVEWLDDRFRGFQKFLDERYPDNVNQILDWTSELDKLLVYTRNEKGHGKIIFYLTQEDKLALHSDFTPELSNYDMGDMQVIGYQARDGHEIEGYLTLPPNHDGRPVPTIVIPHGGPWSRNIWSYNPFVQFFATRGFAVLQVNYRGSLGYGREHLLSGIQKLSTLMLDDIADGANWLVANKYTRADDLFIMGASYGGYAALMSSIRYPELYKAVVSLAAPLDLVQQIKDYKKTDNHFSYEYWKYAVGDPRSQKKFLRQNSPFYRIDDLTVPFMIFHGDKDPIISVEQVRRFEEALKSADVEGSVNIIRGEGHGLTINSNEVYFLESALAHFTKHMSNDDDLADTRPDLPDMTLESVSPVAD